MKIKTYRAATLKAALEQVKRELGSDAFILGQKAVRPRSLLGLAQKTHVEVTAAVDHTHPSRTVQAVIEPPTIVVQETHPFPVKSDDRVHDVHDRVQLSSAVRKAEPAPLLTSPDLPEDRGLLDEIRELKAMVQSISADRTRTTVWLKPMHFSSPAAMELYSSLASRGIEEGLAYSLASATDTEGVSIKAAASVLAGRIRIYPDFVADRSSKSPEVMALLGPTGVGKTTTLAKIAARASMQDKIKVGLVTLDTYRIAAIEQLKTYGEIMGLPVRVVEDVEELDAAIQSFSDRDLVLVDTTGRSHRDVCQERELAEFMAASEGIRKALVVSATTRPSDLTEIIDRYEIFSPNCLIFTKLDETDVHGSIVNELVRSGKPLAYVTIGQGVPQDILRMDARQIIDLAIGPDRKETWERIVQSARTAKNRQKSRETNKSSRKQGQ